MGNTTKRMCKVNSNTILEIIGMGSVLENEVMDEVKHDNICREYTAGNPATIYHFSEPDSILMTAAQCVIIMDTYQGVYEEIILNY